MVEYNGSKAVTEKKTDKTTPNTQCQLLCSRVEAFPYSSSSLVLSPQSGVCLFQN